MKKTPKAHHQKTPDDLSATTVLYAQATKITSPEPLLQRAHRALSFPYNRSRVPSSQKDTRWRPKAAHAPFALGLLSSGNENSVRLHLARKNDNKQVRRHSCCSLRPQKITKHLRGAHPCRRIVTQHRLRSWEF